MYVEQAIRHAIVSHNELGELLTSARQSHRGAPRLQQNWNTLFFPAAQLALSVINDDKGRQFCRAEKKGCSSFAADVARPYDFSLIVARRVQKFAHLIPATVSLVLLFF